MNNNNIQTDRYLQNEMSASEKAAFEDQLTNDLTLKQEVDIQRQIMNAAIHAGIKTEFAKAMHGNNIFKKPATWVLLAAASLTLILVYNFRQLIFPENEIHQEAVVNTMFQKSLPFINPPLPAVDVPFIEYSINAEKADTIFYPTGSVICFPPASMLDEFGEPVKGNVKIAYREFVDPLDFFVSGIPMSYDSAAVKYNFESSGMCEIHAYKNDKAVFVNKNARPEINLASNNNSALHNVYFLDTVNRKWEYTGKDIVTELKKIARSKQTSTAAVATEKNNIPVKPVRPALASGSNPAFSIEIEPGSFEELFAYDRLKFEVTDQSNYRRSDANEQWKNVELKHTAKEGIYTITFTNDKRKVFYTVRPVVEEADYEVALKIFNEKNKAYEQSLKNRIVKTQALTDSITAINNTLVEKMNKDNEWNNKINNLVIESNKKVRALRQLKMEDIEKATEANKLIMQAQWEIMQATEQRYPSDAGMNSVIIRSFSINGFGVWNCDHPQYPTQQVPLFAKFTDSLNYPVNFSSVAVVYAGFNGITQFPSQQISIIPGKENMIWGIKDKTFFYFTYKDFAKTGIDRNSKTFVFQMRQTKKEISSYSEIRELAGNL